MPSHKDVRSKAQAFLEVVSAKARLKLGTNFEVRQNGVWWSLANANDSHVVVRSSGPSRMMQSGGYERTVINRFSVNTYYQLELMDNEFREQTELQKVIMAAGIEPGLLARGFCFPLVVAWCSLSEALEWNGQAVQTLLDEFADAVTRHKSTTTYRDAIVNLDFGGVPVVLGDGVVIRRISEDELYEFSQERITGEPFTIQFSPADTWSILEIQTEHSVETSPTAQTLYQIREAVIGGLALVQADPFSLLPVGMHTNFGRYSVGTATYGGHIPRQFGSPFAGRTTSLSATAREELIDVWPGVKDVMVPGSHYLALPLRRLIDGWGRGRMDDRIIDYTIGLEALLLNIRDELRYRFALRGASILVDAFGDKKQRFQELKDLYDSRSDIVHGQNISSLNLHAMQTQGEKFLREIWKWFFRRRELSRDEAIAILEDRILG